MSNLELTLSITLMSICLVLAMVGLFFFGYHRGAKFYRKQEAEQSLELVETPEPAFVGYLEPTTGPITVIPAEAATHSITIIPAVDELHQLKEQILMLKRLVSLKDGLRMRYLRLLREDRAMVKQIFTHAETRLTPYWNRWANTQMSSIEMLLAPS